MSRDQKTVIGLVAVLALVCIVIACLCGLLAGGVGAMGIMRRTRVPVRSFQRELWATPEPQDPRSWPEGVPYAALVVEVTKDAPADRAGLEPGDLVVAVDGERLARRADLRTIIARYVPGDRVELTIQRAGQEQQVQVRLGDDPDAPGRPYLGVTFQLIPMGLD